MEAYGHPPRCGAQRGKLEMNGNQFVCRIRCNKQLCPKNKVRSNEVGLAQGVVDVRDTRGQKVPYKDVPDQQRRKVANAGIDTALGELQTNCPYKDLN